MRNFHAAPDLVTRRSAPQQARPKGPTIWAIGGGKGGVGKSVVACNLAVTAARSGASCALVDVDLGGANLHTLLGMEAPRRGLAQFLDRRVASLSGVMVETPYPNLRLVSGARAPVEVANPRHSQKEKLLRHIRNLPVDHVFLDLSAGAAYNVLDFFVGAQHGILVVVPEPTAIENTYHFLKAAYFRSLRVAARRSPVRSALQRLLEQRTMSVPRSPRELLAGVAALDPSAGAALAEQARAFAPRLLINQARTVAHRELGWSIVRACREYLGTDVAYLGALERDECVRDAIQQRRPAVEAYPGSPFAQDLAAIVERSLRADARSEDAHGAPEPPADGRRPDPLALHGLDVVASRPPPPKVERPEPSPTDAGGTAAASPPPDVSEPGAFLRWRREQLGLPLGELSRRTRIRSLEHLEQERFELLPPEAYVRGYVVQYARALGLDEGEALASCFLERFRRALLAAAT